MRWRLFSFAVGLASLSTIALGLSLTRIFSVTMYYHFAFMVISVAMLGLSISGVTISFLPGFFRERRAPLLAAGFMLAFSLLTLQALATTLDNPISLKNWRDNLGRLSSLYVSAGLAHLSSGFAISLAIASAKQRIGQVYAFDLIGASLGCMLLIPALSLLGGPGAVIACAATGALAAGLFALSGSERATLPRKLMAGAALVLAGVLGFVAVTENQARRFGVARNSEKFLGNRPVLFEKWNAFSQITVAPAGAADHRWIFIDADAATRIWSGEIAKLGYEPPRRYGEVRVASLAYAIRNKHPALIIGPGGGTDVISALKHGVPKVMGVEVNPIIVNDVMKGAFADFSGRLYADPRVEVVVDEGRSFVRRSPIQYGSIQATLVDTWAASSSGAFTLSENNLYTVEAFKEFFGKLHPGGLISITRWYDASQPKEFLRLVGLARQALEERGVPAAEIARHFVLASDLERRGTMLVNRDPFTTADVQALADRAAEGQLRLLFAPMKPTGPLAGSGPQQQVAHEDQLLASFLRAPDAAAFLAKLPYDASPTTDDKPFFFYNLRAGDLLGVLDRLAEVEINNVGVAILLALLLGATLLTVVFVVLPLVLLERRALQGERGTKLRLLGYFICLGLGFILVELGFMQNFVLFLGHPIYALAVVLASLLAASGVGSALSDWGARRWGARSYLRRAVGALALILALYAFALTPLFQALLGLPIGVRIFLAVILVFAPGLLMGALLPTGVRMANRFGAGTVSWAWGLNGAASVVGSILAILLSMNLGFTLVLLVGIVVYALGALVVPNIAPTEATEAPASTTPVISGSPAPSPAAG